MIVITGPTASGKSALAVSLAEKLETEIISADSRQIYQGIPIVTAVPTKEERNGIPHHLLEILPLDAYYSAVKFQEDTDRIIQNIFREKNTVIVCGGSMLYIDALLSGIDELPTVPDTIRNNLMLQWKENGDKWLIEQLKEKDPDYYNKVDLKNLKRVFHAIEISITAGQPYSSLLTKENRKSEMRQLPFEVIKICLNGSRDQLFNRINQRVIKMIETGLEEEARSVYHLRHLNSLNTVGLKEMFAWFDGTMTKEEAISRIQKNTRVYAKKQMTWHKRDENLRYLDFDEGIMKNRDKVLGLLV
ncbi:MAG: tRNA (adenosine(37)-N6)-dimethylallyltransferase MiaA [Muribaculaceae bacterium]|nr:tRNA (adenosine(37)-N6)-dimethylallyltransferase MiaA [Muribaculaceae bacterium]